ncbi:MAG: hypothetical protein PHC61_06395, partial [Chitinivibrionales bacterium]|nr:hypothetical protein [Chitinivibrionales bacterium]
VRAALAALGLREIITNSMSSEKRRALLTPQIAPVAILNPLSPDMAQMRTCLLGNALEAAAYNSNRKNLNNRFFEIGSVFHSRGADQLAHEPIKLAITLEGAWAEKTWNTETRPNDFYILKGLLQAIQNNLGIASFNFEPARLDWFENGGFTLGDAANLTNGVAGKISPRLAEAFEVKESVFYCELDITQALAARPPTPVFSALPRFPAIARDYCFVMAESILAQAFVTDIKTLSDLIESVVPFDVYRGEKLGRGLKSVAFSVGMRSAERTLTDAEADAIGARIVALMGQKYQATLRT